MDTMSIPGFTAEATLYMARRNYRATATAPIVSGVGELTPATRKNGKLEWIDCNGFPENNYCRECGNTGPQSFVCCPDGYCVVIDKTPLTVGKIWDYRAYRDYGARLR